MRAKRVIGFLCVVSVCGVTPALGHHSTAMFDMGSELTIEGTITRYDWKNPHVYMAVQTTDADGKRYEQQIEAGASSVLLPLGLTPDALRLGDRVTVTANPNRRGAGRIVLGRSLRKEDGTELPLNIAARSIRPRGTAVAQSIEGTWFPPSAAFFGLMGSRGAWQLTARAAQASARFDDTQTAHADCIPVTAPTLMVYPVVTTIAVGNDEVVFDVDWMVSRRTVYMDGRGHPENGERSLHGHSIGHWAGDTLVVDTVGYADHKEGIALGLPSGAGKHTVERFSLSEDGRSLNYEVFLEDPEYLAAPVTYAAQWQYRPDLEPTGQACDLDVAQRFLNE